MVALLQSLNTNCKLERSVWGMKTPYEGAVGILQTVVSPFDHCIVLSFSIYGF